MDKPSMPRRNPKRKAASRLYGLKTVDDLARVAASYPYPRFKEPSERSSLDFSPSSSLSGETRAS